MYLGLVEALQRRLLPRCLAISCMRLEKGRVDEAESADQAAVHLAQLIVPEGYKREGGREKDDSTRGEDIVVFVCAISHPHAGVFGGHVGGKERRGFMVLQGEVATVVNNHKQQSTSSGRTLEKAEEAAREI